MSGLEQYAALSAIYQVGIATWNVLAAAICASEHVLQGG